MDTQFNNKPPFNLYFLQNGETKPVVQYFNSEEDLFKYNNPIKVIENIRLDVVFNCDNKQSRLFMDGLETLPENILDEDEDTGEVFLGPSPTPYTLFNNSDYYPIIPGYYRLIVLVEKVKYYSLIQVVPKQLSKTQWEVMKEELEKELRGLAQDIIRKNLGIGNLLNENLPSNLLYKFLVIKKWYPSVMSSLSDLLTKVNFRIRKDYNVVHVDKAKIMDELTVRHRLTHPEEEDYLKIPVRAVEYDLPENRWVKRIIHIITVYLNDFMEALEQHCEQINEEIEELEQFNKDNVRAIIREKKRVKKFLLDSWGISKKMKRAFLVIETAPWYKEVKETLVPSLSPVLMWDPRYRSLFQLYRELHMERFEIELDKNYSFQWKHTAKLYEIWGFIKICRLLSHETLGFKVKSGWIYDSNIDSNKVLIPTLVSGTKIVFEKDDLQLNVVYDSKIPFESTGTHHVNNPIYTTGIHYKPDGRMDVFNKEIYIGSLLFDFKCRPIHGFWKFSKIKPWERPKEMNQLIQYRSQCLSPFLFEDRGESFIRRDINPVPEVWAMYPTDDNAPSNKLIEDQSIRLIKLCPGENNSHICSCLKEFLDGLIDRHNMICGKK